MLNVIRYNSEDRLSLLGMLESLKGRIFTPFQSASEFFSNREKVKQSSARNFSNLIQDLKKSTENLKNLSSNYLLNDETTNKLETLGREFKTDLSKLLEGIKYVPIDQEEDQRLLMFIDSSILSAPSDEIRNKRIKEGEFRIKNKIAPGFKDKGVNGDYLIFAEIIEHSMSQNKRNAVIITADLKNDWFSNDKNQGEGIKYGNRELVSEYNKITSKNLIVMSIGEFNRLMSGEFGKKLNIQSVIQRNAIEYSKRNPSFLDEYLGNEILPAKLTDEVKKWFFIFGAFTRELTDIEEKKYGIVDEYFDCEDEAIARTLEFCNMHAEEFYYYRNRYNLEGFELLKEAFDQGYGFGLKYLVR